MGAQAESEQDSRPQQRPTFGHPRTAFARHPAFSSGLPSPAMSPGGGGYGRFALGLLDASHAAPLRPCRCGVAESGACSLAASVAAKSTSRSGWYLSGWLSMRRAFSSPIARIARAARSTSASGSLASSAAVSRRAWMRAIFSSALDPLTHHWWRAVGREQHQPPGRGLSLTAPSSVRSQSVNATAGSSRLTLLLCQATSASGVGAGSCSSTRVLGRALKTSRAM